MKRALRRWIRLGIIRSGARRPNRKRRHRQHGQALADHRNDIMYGGDLRVVFDALAHSGAREVPQLRDGLLSLLHLEHLVVRLLLRLLKR